MRNTPFVAGPGGVVSADIAVPDHAKQVAFYRQVLTTGRHPLWRDDLTNNRGTPVIGLGARSSETKLLPVQWMPHLQVTDVAESVTSALALGGRELMHGRDAEGRSQWAVLVDPFGAAFGLIPAVSDDVIIDADTGDIGCIAGLTLTASDVSATGAFYEQVIGWSSTTADREGGLDMRRPDGEVSATIRPAGRGDDDLPHVWIIVLPVDDLRDSLEQVQLAGGEVVQPPSNRDYAVVRDLAGAYVGLQSSGALQS